MRELIAKIFGAVSRTTSLMRLSALLVFKRCRCRNDGFCSVWQEILSLLELIAQILGAVERLKFSAIKERHALACLS